MLKIKRPLKWRNIDAGQKEREEKKNKVRIGIAGRATTGTGSRDLPLKNQITPNVHAKQRPGLSITGACLSESSRALSSSSWGSLGTQRKMSGFLLKKFSDYIIPFGTWPDCWYFITKHSSPVVSFYDFSGRINCTSPKYPEDLWSY